MFGSISPAWSLARFFDHLSKPHAAKSFHITVFYKEGCSRRSAQFRLPCYASYNEHATALYVWEIISQFSYHSGKKLIFNCTISLTPSIHKIEALNLAKQQSFGWKHPAAITDKMFGEKLPGSEWLHPLEVHNACVSWLFFFICPIVHSSQWK